MAEIYEGDCITRTLSKYKELATNEENHPTLIKDKTLIQFLIYCLESKDFQCVELSLDTIDSLAQNVHNKKELHMNEIVQTIKDIKDRFDLIRDFIIFRNFSLPGTLRKMSEEIVKKIETPSISKFTERCRFSSNIFKFHVFGLSNENREIVEQMIVRVEGVISVVVNPDHQRIVVRAKEEISVETLAKAISDRIGLRVHLIVKNNENHEFLEDVLQGTDIPKMCGDLSIEELRGDLPSYLPEEFFEEPDSMNIFTSIKSRASNLFNSATTFFLNFYTKWYLTQK